MLFARFNINNQILLKISLNASEIFLLFFRPFENAGYQHFRQSFILMMNDSGLVIFVQISLSRPDKLLRIAVLNRPLEK